jgi:hypothetical protein
MFEELFDNFLALNRGDGSQPALALRHVKAKSITTSSKATREIPRQGKRSFCPLPLSPQVDVQRIKRKNTPIAARNGEKPFQVRTLTKFCPPTPIELLGGV